MRYIVVLALLICGCGRSSLGVRTVAIEDGFWIASRFVDYQAQVVCYRGDKGLACLPCSQVAAGICTPPAEEESQ